MAPRPSNSASSPIAQPLLASTNVGSRAGGTETTWHQPEPAVAPVQRKSLVSEKRPTTTLAAAVLESPAAPVMVRLKA
jgi:hypothetical protein